MTIGRTAVVAIEGPHGSGKTTLMHAAVAHLRAKGVSAVDVPESARSSPFFQAAFLYDGPAIDEWAELHLLGDQISAELQRSRLADVIIVDRTVANVSAYWKVRFPDGSPQMKDLFAAADRFIQEYAQQVYDLVLILSDDFSQERDELRDSDPGFRQLVERQLRIDLEPLGKTVVLVPRGLSQAGRVAFLDKEMTIKGLLR